MQSDVAGLVAFVTFAAITTLFSSLWRWQQVRVDTALRSGDPALAMRTNLNRAFVYSIRRLFHPSTSALNLSTTFSALTDYHVIIAIKASLHSIRSLFYPANRTILRGREKELRIETSTLVAALQKLDRQRDTLTQVASFRSIAASVAVASSSILLLSGAVPLTIGSLFTRKAQQAASLGVARQSIAWLVGCGGTFIVLGMAPAELVSRSSQTRAVIAGIWGIALIVVGMAVWLVVILLRQRKLRFRVTTLFAATTAVAVLASLLPLVKSASSGIVEYPPELWLHAKGWNGIDADVLRSALKLTRDRGFGQRFNGLHMAGCMSASCCQSH